MFCMQVTERWFYFSGISSVARLRREGVCLILSGMSSNSKLSSERAESISALVAYM